jgi:hypothetical protein
MPPVIQHFLFDQRAIYRTPVIQMSQWNYLIRTTPLRVFLLAALFCIPSLACATQNDAPMFRAVALAEHAGIHRPFVEAAKS